MATAIMAVGLAAAAICLQIGLRNFDTARKTSLVTQAIQDEAERLRLKNWTTISALPASQEIQGELPDQFDQTLLAELVDSGNCTIVRTVTDVAGFEGMKQITIVAEWTGLDRITRSRTLHFRYADGGTSDYYYGTN